MTNREVDDYLQSKDLSFFKADNLWQAGDLKYIDVNRDGKVDPGKGTLDDHGDLRIIGNTTPKYSFGINLKAGYKGFQVSTLFQGVGKRDFPLAGSTYLFGGRTTSRNIWIISVRRIPVPICLVWPIRRQTITE